MEHRKTHNQPLTTDPLNIMSINIMKLVWAAGLPPNEKIVLLAYADHADDSGRSIYPSIHRLACMTGYTPRSVQFNTRKLTRRGLLVPDGSGPRGTNRWRIPLQPLEALGSSQAGENFSGGDEKSPIPGVKPVSPEPSFKPSLKVEQEVSSPNLFKLYENNIGFISPMIADQLKDAEAEYPGDWFAPAIQQAVNNNARSWSYVKAILERWKRDGYLSDNRAAKKPRRPLTREGLYRAWLAEGE